MISILISTYNYNCYRLVCDLQRQCTALGCDFEILVGDDASRDQLSKVMNMKVKELDGCQYLPSEKNVGLASTRNRLAEASRGDWLIFLDSDAEVCSDDFVKMYVDSQDKADVIVGGIKTPELNRDEVCSVCETADLGALHSHFVVNRTLRYKYERKADEMRAASVRSLRPYSQMSCFNVMMRRSAFMEIKFDEHCKEYGYEDALFGADLARRGVSILHIDNPLIHRGIDTNDVFLKKSETALRTLKSLDGRMAGHSNVENMAIKIKKLHLAWAVQLLYSMSKGMLRRNLLSQHPSLFLFSLYKLGYFMSL